jgi:hypothetical protein
MSNNKPMLFYSKKCVNCQKLWALLSQQGKLNDYLKICVEENPTRIPPMIKEVPSILISKDRPIISGAAIPMFLKSVPSQASVQSSSVPNFSEKPNLDKKLEPPPAFESATNNLGGIKDFSPVEMGSYWSDSYSFIQDNPSPLSFSFEFLNDANSLNKELTGPQTRLQEVDTRRSGKISNFNERVEMLQKMRQNSNI